MKFSLTIGGLAVATTAVLIGQMNTDAVAARGSSFAGCAPDVIVGDVQEIIRHGTVGDITAYSIGTNSCNMGCDYLAWEANNNSHPTIGGSMYRVLELEKRLHAHRADRSLLAQARLLCTSADPVWQLFELRWRGLPRPTRLGLLGPLHCQPQRTAVRTWPSQ